MLNWLIVSELIFVWLIDGWQLLPLIWLLWPMVPFDGTTPCSDGTFWLSYVLAEFDSWYGFECGSNCVDWCKIEFVVIVVMHAADATAVNRPSIGDVVSIKPFFLTGSSVYKNALYFNHNSLKILKLARIGFEKPSFSRATHNEIDWKSNCNCQFIQYTE